MRGSRARLVNRTNGEKIAVVVVANTSWHRTVGLLSRGSLPLGDGLILDPCRMIHTCCMRFSIDVVFVGPHGNVVKTVERLRPFRLAWGGFKTRLTIELASGAIRSAGLAVNDRISIEPEEV